MTEQMTPSGILVLCAGIVGFWIATIALVRKHAKRAPDESRRGRRP
jgi:hypothetical protein